MIQKKISESVIFLKSTLDNIYKWLKTRKFDLNPTKCKILKIKKNKPFDPIDLLIDKTKIPTVFKNLGVYIFENLNWNVHISYSYNVAKVSS